MIRNPRVWMLISLVLLLAFAACSSGGTEATEEKSSQAMDAPAGRSAIDKAAPVEPAIAAEPESAPEKLAEADKTETRTEESVTVDKAREAIRPKDPKPADVAPKVDALRSPTLDYAKAPAEFKVRFETTKGNFVVRLVRDWSPRGVDHFYHLVKIGYYTDIAFFRAIEGFMVQFGMHGDPSIGSLWRQTNIQDDSVKASNKRGYLTYAKSSAPNSRSTQLFINLVDNPNLDSYGFSPMGEVVEGMSVVDSLYMVGEGAPRGPGPSQELIGSGGNKYLRAEFPNLDYIKQVVLLD